MNKYLYDLTDRVHANKQNAHNRAVTICKNYIFDHIFEAISAHELAQLVRLHPVYLSNLFKKETGIPLGLYIQWEKIAEAKKCSISRICQLRKYRQYFYLTNKAISQASLKKSLGPPRTNIVKNIGFQANSSLSIGKIKDKALEHYREPLHLLNRVVLLIKLPYSTIGALKTRKDLNLPVPEKLTVLGLDDISTVSELLSESVESDGQRLDPAEKVIPTKLKIRRTN